MKKVVFFFFFFSFSIRGRIRQSVGEITTWALISARGEGRPRVIMIMAPIIAIADHHHDHDHSAGVQSGLKSEKNTERQKKKRKMKCNQGHQLGRLAAGGMGDQLHRGGPFGLSSGEITRPEARRLFVRESEEEREKRKNGMIFFFFFSFPNRSSPPVTRDDGLKSPGEQGRPSRSRL